MMRIFEMRRDAKILFVEVSSAWLVAAVYEVTAVDAGGRHGDLCELGRLPGAGGCTFEWRMQQAGWASVCGDVQTPACVDRHGQLSHLQRCRPCGWTERFRLATRNTPEWGHK